MATFDRTTIVRGPCAMTYNGATFYSKEDVTLTYNHTTFDKPTDAYGLAGRGKTDLQVVVEFEPVGEIEDIATLFPYGSTVIGSDIYGSTDTPLVIISVDQTYTIPNAQITQLPSIRATSQNTAFGPIQFTGLIANNADPVDLDNYIAASAGGALPTNFDPATIIAGPYEATFGALTFYSQDGFEISFDLELAPKFVDGIGTVGMTLSDTRMNVTAIPVGNTETSLDAFYDTMEAGKELVSDTLAIATACVGGLEIDSDKVQVTAYEKMFSSETNRIGSVTWSSVREFTAGVPNPAYTIGIVPAP